MSHTRSSSMEIIKDGDDRATIDLSWLTVQPVLVLGLVLCVVPLAMSIVPREHLPYETRRATMRFFVLASMCTSIYHLVAAIPFSSVCEHCSFWSDFEVSTMTHLSTQLNPFGNHCWY
jgi:hypothetical protein